MDSPLWSFYFSHETANLIRAVNHELLDFYNKQHSEQIREGFKICVTRLDVFDTFESARDIE